MRHATRTRATALLILGLSLPAAPASALKVATWNLWEYPASFLSTRQPLFRTAMTALDPDVLVCQEINSVAGRDSFFLNVLDVIQPGQWSRQWITVGSGEGMAVFWKTANVTVSNFSSFQTGGPRRVLRCTLTPAGYGPADTLRLYSIHLKAGTPDPGTTDSLTRRIEGRAIRDTLNNTPVGVPFLLLGDSNFYGDWEGGYQWLTESQLDNDGRLKDPLIMPGTWHNSFDYRVNDTQCPCLNNCLAGFSGGGMDDRFDLILTAYNMQDGAGFDLVSGSTHAFGNDGQHFNTDINGGGFNNDVGLDVATALKDAADHIPALVQIQLPAKISASASLDFGRVIVGAAGIDQSLSVANAATAPADELNYSLSPPAGYTAPGGSFVANPGAPANLHTIGLTTSSPGDKSGTLTIPSNDPDAPNAPVSLTASVLRHASPSFDASAPQTTRTVELGARESGTFVDAAVPVYNRGFDAIQALLQLTGATITGGDGRFSIVGGFSPVSVGATPATLTIHFDDTGATLDQQYEATLTLNGADEALPGAQPTPDLVATLRARVVASATGVQPPTHVLRFESARPNPLRHETRFAFELPVARDASLEIYDLGGRRVASLVSGEQSAGRHEVVWRADARGARVPGGLYFVRFATPGLASIERVVVLP